MFGISFQNKNYKQMKGRKKKTKNVLKLTLQIYWVLINFKKVIRRERGWS